MNGGEQKTHISWTEWLVIGLIVGLLGLAAIWAIASARTTARDAVRLSDVRQLQVGLELYFNDHSAYPEVTEVLPLGQATSFCLGDDGFSGNCSDAQYLYLESIAMPPKNGLNDSVCGGVDDVYCYLASDGSYRIQFELEKRHALLELASGLNCATETGFVTGACPLPDGFEVIE